jgi:hypothetical protein
MKSHGMLLRSSLLAATLGLLAASSGCQTTMNGQTLPSPHYLDDDIQYFPAGPEFLLPNAVRAMEEYQAQQAGWEADLGGAP